MIGVAQSRTEYGPAAPGNRTILADPRPVANRVRISELVKARESFSPFAPLVIEEESERYFDLYFAPPSYRFMTIVGVRQGGPS